jgi:hypothetical protein
MYSIRIKGTRNPNQIEMVKLSLVFYRTNYTRVGKVLNNSGLYKDWDSKKQHFKGNTPEIKKKNNLLQKEILKYLKVAEQWEYNDKEWNPIELSHYYDKNKNGISKCTNVSKVLDMIIDTFIHQERVKNGVTISSANNAKGYKYLMHSLEKFTRSKYHREFSQYLFHDINEQFILNFAVFIQQQGIKNNTNGGVYAKLKYLHATFTYAQKKAIPGVNMKAFDAIKAKLNSRFFVPKTVSAKTIQLIENVDRTKLKEQEHFYLDLFLFSFYAGGMSNVDVCFLVQKSIKENEIVFERIKCNKHVKVVLIDKAKLLIEKYKLFNKTNYVFPIFRKPNMTEKNMFGLVSRLSIKVNKTLKKICAELGIVEKVTWGTARSNFISKMIDEGYHPLQIAEQVGNSPQTIYKYYYTNTNKEEMRKHLNDIF